MIMFAFIVNDLDVKFMLTLETNLNLVIEIQHKVLASNG